MEEMLLDGSFQVCDDETLVQFLRFDEGKSGRLMIDNIANTNYIFARKYYFK